MENVKKFFEEVIKTEEAKEILASVKKPETEEEVAKTYVEVAAKLGIGISVEEINTYLAERFPSVEVDDEELSQLSGGGENNECESTFRHEENCWWNDGCDRFFNDYGNYNCWGNYYYFNPDGTRITLCSQLFYKKHR